MLEVPVIVLVATLAAALGGAALLARRLRLRATALAPVPLLVLAGLGLRVPGAADGAPVLVVDVSFSTGIPEPDLRAVGEAAGLPAGRTRVLVFAERAVALAAKGDAWPAAGPSAARAGRGGSDLGAALRAALPLVTAGGEVVVATDGRVDPRAARDAGIALRARGARLRVVPHGRGWGGDARVDRLSVPSRVRPGEGFPALVRITGPRGVSIGVELRVDGDLRATRTAVLTEPGSAGFRIAVEGLPAGWHEIEARVLPPPGDPAPENDRQAAGVVAAGGRRVLLVNAAAAEPELSRRGFACDLAGPAATANPADYDLVVLRDVRAAALVEGGRGLGAFVRGGGGLLVLGGSSSFGPGGYAGRPLEAVLPLRSEAGEEGLLVVLLVDRSGTMSNPFSPGGPAKIDAARAAARRLLDVLPPHAELLLVPFSDRIDGRPEAYPLATAEERAAAGAAIGSVGDAHGGTRLVEPLDAARRAITEAGKRSLVLLLTDGRTEDEDPERIGTAADGVRRAGGRLFPVAVGEDADLALLDRLAGPGRTAARVSGAGEIGDAFLSALLEVEGEDKVRTGLFSVVPGPGADSPVRAPPPAIRGYVRTFPASGAEVWLNTAGGEPVAAGQRFGLGVTVATSTDPLGDWAGTWAGTGILGDLAERAARPAALSGPRVTVGESAGGLRIEARVPSAEPVLAARLDGPDGARDLEMRRAGRDLYVAGLPSATPGAWRLAVRAGGAILDGGFGFPWAPEFGATGVDPTGIEALRAALGEGPAPESPGPDVSFLVALAGLALLLLDRILKMRGSVGR